MQLRRLTLIFIGILSWMPISHAAILDDFNASVFNQGANWTINQVIQSTNPTDSITYDQAETPGVLTITYDDTQGSDQTTLNTWSPDTLDVNEFVQLKVKILQGGGTPNVRVGLALATVTNPANRANVLVFGLRSDGVARAHAYADGGNEFNDPAASLAGYVNGDELTIRIERVSSLSYLLYYGLNGPASSFLGTIDWPASGGTAPSVPAFFTDNGLADFKASIEDFEIGTVTPEPTPTPTPTPTPVPTPPAANLDVDLFDGSALAAEWNTSNYPQRDGDLDTTSAVQTSGKLLVTQTDLQGAAQVTLFLRDDVTLEPGETVQVDVRVVAGNADPLVRAGLGLATVSSGINGNRANTIWYGIRNDGLMRGNGFGSVGDEIGDIAPTVLGYVPGTDVITSLIWRNDAFNYSCWYALNGSEWVYAGSMNMTASTAPFVPGLFFGVGLSNIQIEFDNFKMYKNVPVNRAREWVAYQ